MMDGTQVARCEQGQGGGRLSWDGWPATMNTKCLRVDVVLGGLWTVDGGWLLGVGVVVVAVIPWMVRQPWEGLIAAAIMVELLL